MQHAEVPFKQLNGRELSYFTHFCVLRKHSRRPQQMMQCGKINNENWSTLRNPLNYGNFHEGSTENGDAKTIKSFSFNVLRPICIHYPVGGKGSEQFRR